MTGKQWALRPDMQSDDPPHTEIEISERDPVFTRSALAQGPGGGRTKNVPVIDQSAMHAANMVAISRHYDRLNNAAYRHASCAGPIM